MSLEHWRCLEIRASARVTELEADYAEARALVSNSLTTKSLKEAGELLKDIAISLTKAKAELLDINVEIFKCLAAPRPYHPTHPHKNADHIFISIKTAFTEYRNGKLSLRDLEYGVNDLVNQLLLRIPTEV